MFLAFFLGALLLVCFAKVIREEIYDRDKNESSNNVKKNNVNIIIEDQQDDYASYQEELKKKQEAEREAAREREREKRRAAERERELAEKLAKELEDKAYNSMLYSICEKLKQMNLYDKLYETELENTYPLFKTRYAKVDDINKILHKAGKEVTYNEGYYILVEPRTHEERIKSLTAMKINPQPKINTPEGYRNDIVNNRGTFHLPRESNGRIASGSDEDNYDDESNVN